MSEDKNSDIFTLLQPELLTTERLISYLKSRCSNTKNLSSLSKEQLVSLFRRVILPLPQRQCWANRRKKLLTARGLKSSPEGRQEEPSSHPGVKRLPSGGDRLKPALDTNTPNKIRITSSDSNSTASGLDNIIINDRRRLDGREERGNKVESPSPTRIHLKRSSYSVDKHEKCSTESSSRESMKKQRTAIRWP